MDKQSDFAYKINEFSIRPNENYDQTQYWTQQKVITIETIIAYRQNTHTNVRRLPRFADVRIKYSATVAGGPRRAYKAQNDFSKKGRSRF